VSPARPQPAARPRAPGDEPVPGYRLLEPLGKGGFGEVWKCEAPGGLTKAIKLVAGASLPDGRPSPATQELEALQRIKAVRHPFILSLERVDVLDGLLVLIMELADRSLQAIQADYLASGRPG